MTSIVLDRLATDTVLIAGGYLFGTDGWSAAAVATPTASGLIYQNIIRQNSVAPNNANMVGVAAIFMTAILINKDYYREK